MGTALRPFKCPSNPTWKSTQSFSASSTEARDSRDLSTLRRQQNVEIKNIELDRPPVQIPALPSQLWPRANDLVASLSSPVKWGHNSRNCLTGLQLNDITDAWICKHLPSFERQAALSVPLHSGCPRPAQRGLSPDRPLPAVNPTPVGLE